MSSSYAFATVFSTGTVRGPLRWVNFMGTGFGRNSKVFNGKCISTLHNTVDYTLKKTVGEVNYELFKP